MKRFFFATVAVLFACGAAAVAATNFGLGPHYNGHWGDQGDGTFRNPILNADYPDVDVEQVGDTYYMISSKQHMAPGMVILQSQDMVNWTTIGHVWPTLSWGAEYNWDRMDGYGFGVWAGDLAWHHGTWYCYQIDPRHGLYMSSARDIRGPWTEALRVLPAQKVSTDPAAYWDDDGHAAYLVCNTGGKLRSPGSAETGNEIRIFKLSWDGRTVLDAPGVCIYTGHGAEAAKIYKIEGHWYIFLAEWFGPPGRPDGDRKQIVLRSTTASIYGPYERRVVLQRGNGVERSCSQGALMKAPDGSWWFTHQLIQNTAAPFQGRPQCLEPVAWRDGWPIIGQDVNGDGIGEPVMAAQRKPIPGFVATPAHVSDDFGAATLSPDWEWNHNPRDSRWSLTERRGWLRLKASRPVSDAAHPLQGATNTFWRACNTVSRRIMGTGPGTAVAKFDLAGMKPGQRAGFARFGFAYHLLGVAEDDAGKRHVFFRETHGAELRGPELPHDTLYVRTFNNGDRAYFEFSTDGEAFQRFGPEFTLKFGRWTGDRLGFFSWNEQADAGQLDVDWFHYDFTK